MSFELSQLPQVAALLAGDFLVGVDTDGTAPPAGTGGDDILITAANLAASLAAIAGIPVKQAATNPSYTLVNGTGTILSWTAPNDGQLHWASVAGTLFATAAETGGNINLLYTDPGGNANSTAIWAGGLSGANTGTAKFVAVKAGTTVSLQQTVALSAGGPSTLWAALFGI